MSMVSNLDLIRRIPLFSLLTDEQARRIADAVAKRRFRRGEAVVEQGQKGNALFILLNGRARVVVGDEKGREVFLAVLEAGDFLGEMSLIDHEPHSATVRAELQTDMLVLGQPEFSRCVHDSAALAYSVMHGLVKRLRAADRQIESLALLDVHGRVARALLEASEVIDGRSVVRSRVHRQDLAKAIGASREMVSRVMRHLEAQGVIQTQADGSLILRQERAGGATMRG